MSRTPKRRIGLWGNIMASNLVNLDAIIPREDWDALPDIPARDVGQSESKITFKCIEFEKSGLAFKFLKKPEFQRETSSWEPYKVVNLIKSFLEGDLIPSVIIWTNPKSNNLFVIDGAHRLASLIAWIHDDYGNGKLSQTFFKEKIPPEQKNAHKKTKDLIEEKIGTYESIKNYEGQQNTVKAGYQANLLKRQITVQEIGGGSSKAEESFFRINQEAAPISETELKLIESRGQSYGIATRALIRAGVGHIFWKQFSGENQREIEKIADEAYSLLFHPPLSEPISAGLDLPIGGRGYSTESVSLLFSLVNLTISPPQKRDKTIKKIKTPKAESGKPLPPDDADGSKTINLLKGVLRLVRRMAGKNPSSLALHPIVYFYSATGRFQPTAFLATASLFLELDASDRDNKTDKIAAFTVCRERFERFLVRHRFLINQMVLKFGSMEKSHEPMLRLYRSILACALDKKTDEEILADITSQFPYLRKESIADFTFSEADFSTRVKSAAIRKAGLGKVYTCELCHAPIHPSAISHGHQTDIKDGGDGSLKNNGFEHPYCNSAKDKLLPMFNAQK